MKPIYKQLATWEKRHTHARTHTHTHTHTHTYINTYIYINIYIYIYIYMGREREWVRERENEKERKRNIKLRKMWETIILKATVYTSFKDSKIFFGHNPPIRCLHQRAKPLWARRRKKSKYLHWKLLQVLSFILFVSSSICLHMCFNIKWIIIIIIIIIIE